MPVAEAPAPPALAMITAGLPQEAALTSMQPPFPPGLQQPAAGVLAAGSPAPAVSLREVAVAGGRVATDVAMDAAPGAAVVSDEWFADMLEDALTSYFVAAAVQPTQVQIKARSEIRGWSDLQQLLEGVGFRLSHPDPWAAVGVAPSRSAQEQRTAVTRRLELGRLFLSIAGKGNWTEQEEDAAAEAERQLQVQASKILEEMATRGSRQGKKDAWHGTAVPGARKCGTSPARQLGR